MFFHNLKYSLKTLFRNRMLIFWTFAFPIILGTLFNMAFSNIESNEKLEVFDIAVVDNEEFTNNVYIKNGIDYLSKDGKDQYFNTKYVSLDEAEDLLENKEIEGYVYINDGKTKVVVKNSGINQTILKSIVEQLEENSVIVDSVASNQYANGNTDFEKIYAIAQKAIDEATSNIKDISSSNLSYTMIEFYTLIAMACLYGGMLGLYAINQCLPNMSSKGKRFAVAPLSKFKVIMSSVCASYITQLIGVFLLFFYTIFVLNVDYGTHTKEVVELIFAGSLAGLSIGLAIGTLVKSNENTKTGMVISISMLCCFLCGMMGITMKYTVDKFAPFVNKINPGNMITDGFYALYYYETFDRFYFNIISLLVFSVVLIAISCYSLRGQKYDSI